LTHSTHSSRQSSLTYPSFLLQHKKHSSEVDEAKLAAAKAFLEQHLQQTAGGAGSSTAAAALAAAAAAGGGGSSRPSGSSKREKPAGELPPDVDPITVDEDYFARAAEFTAWLQETKHLYFNGERRVFGCGWRYAVLLGHRP
jgi:hypothetical protein